VAREAVVNALRHAQASWVRVSLAGGLQALRLEVLDDGVGLAPGAQQLRPGHLGLLGMRERAASIGADCVVQSPASGGTRVCLDWKAAG
jgi:signal transduction histidine kinase